MENNNNKTPCAPRRNGLAATPRLDHLDGLRGCAALIVVAEHYRLSFFPAAPRWIEVLTNGDFAVYLFFLMSGYVLTPSFGKAPRVRASLLKRIVRLVLPAMLALLFAAALYLCAPSAAERTIPFTHSDFMMEQTTGRADHVWHGFLADISGTTLLAGFNETSLFEGVRQFVPSAMDSLMPPLWTLHIELWGSALVLLAVWGKAHSRLLHLALCAAALALLGVHVLVLFLVGHLLYQLQHNGRFVAVSRSTLAAMLGLALLLAGCMLLAGTTLPGTWAVASLLGPGHLHAVSWLDWEQELGACLFFAGILLTPWSQRMLSSRCATYLGRISFPLYLVHWPVMMVLASSTFLLLVDGGTVLAAICATAAGGTISLGAAELFERWCDRPAVEAGRRLGKGGLSNPPSRA